MGKPLCWAIVLLLIIMYVFGVGLMQILADDLENRIQRGDELNSELGVGSDATAHYGSLVLTIYTLFMSISGGINWETAAAPILRVSPLLAGCFCLYIAFAVFCVLNIVTGIFVDNASKLTMVDEEMMLFNELEDRKRWVREIKRLF